jgi:hypothetical protein
MRAANLVALKPAKRHEADQKSARDEIDDILSELGLVTFAVAGLAHELSEDAAEADGIVTRIHEVIAKVHEVGDNSRCHTGVGALWVPFRPCSLYP